MIYKIAKYLIHPLEGTDGKLSGKRIIGTCLAIVACYIGVHGVKHAIEHIDSIAILVGTFLMSSALFWGITSVADFKNQQLNTRTDITKSDIDSVQTTTIDKTTTKD